MLHLRAPKSARYPHPRLRRPLRLRRPPVPHPHESIGNVEGTWSARGAAGVGGAEGTQELGDAKFHGVGGGAVELPVCGQARNRSRWPGLRRRPPGSPAATCCCCRAGGPPPPLLSAAAMQRRAGVERGPVARTPPHPAPTPNRDPHPNPSQRCQPHPNPTQHSRVMRQCLCCGGHQPHRTVTTQQITFSTHWKTSFHAHGGARATSREGRKEHGAAWWSGKGGRRSQTHAR
jgi:hypothetical protein